MKTIFSLLFSFFSVLHAMEMKVEKKPIEVRQNQLLLLPLHKAIVENDSAKVIELIQNAPNPQELVNKSIPRLCPTPLILACKGYKQLLKIQKNCSHDVEKLIQNKDTIIEILLTKGAEVNAQFTYGSFTIFPLYVAVQERYVYAIHALLKANADINQQDNEGYTSLHCAALNGYVEIATFLLECRANNDSLTNPCSLDYKHSISFNPEKSISFKPYELALAVDHKFVAELLINWPNHYGKTPLHNAVCINNVDEVKKLLELNALAHTHDNQHKTPLHQAVINDNFIITKLLLEKHVPCDDRDALGNTALHYAFINNNLKISILLLSFDFKNNLMSRTNNDEKTALELVDKDYYDKFNSIFNYWKIKKTPQ